MFLFFFGYVKREHGDIDIINDVGYYQPLPNLGVILKVFCFQISYFRQFRKQIWL